MYAETPNFLNKKTIFFLVILHQTCVSMSTRECVFPHECVWVSVWVWSRTIVSLHTTHSCSETRSAILIGYSSDTNGATSYHRSLRGILSTTISAPQWPHPPPIHLSPRTLGLWCCRIQIFGQLAVWLIHTHIAKHVPIHTPMHTHKNTRPHVRVDYCFVSPFVVCVYGCLPHVFFSRACLVWLPCT